MKVAVLVVNVIVLVVIVKVAVVTVTGISVTDVDVLDAIVVTAFTFTGVVAADESVAFGGVSVLDGRATTVGALELRDVCVVEVSVVVAKVTDVVLVEDVVVSIHAHPQASSAVTPFSSAKLA